MTSADARRGRSADASIIPDLRGPKKRRPSRPTRTSQVSWEWALASAGDLWVGEAPYTQDPIIRPGDKATAVRRPADTPYDAAVFELTQFGEPFIPQARNMIEG